MSCPGKPHHDAIIPCPGCGHVYTRGEVAGMLRRTRLFECRRCHWATEWGRPPLVTRINVQGKPALYRDVDLLAWARAVEAWRET